MTNLHGIAGHEVGVGDTVAFRFRTSLRLLPLQLYHVIRQVGHFHLLRHSHQVLWQQEVQFSSVQLKMVYIYNTLCKTHMHSPVSQKFLQWCLWNHSNVGLTDVGPFVSPESPKCTPLSQKFLQWCLWNHSNVGLTDVGPFVSPESPQMYSPVSEVSTVMPLKPF